MYDTRQEVIAIIEQVWSELNRQVDGLANALDWRKAPDQWSAREVLSHLAGTPAHGPLPWVQQVIREQHPVIQVIGNDPFLTPQRQSSRLSDLLSELEHIKSSLVQILTSATEKELARKGLFRFATRPEEERTPLVIAGSSFDTHWRNHVKQLARVRDDLGLAQI